MCRGLSELWVVHGLVGSGKTRLLVALDQSGQQVIDLERIARHRGSAFGAHDDKAQPDRHSFHRELRGFWNRLDGDRPVFIESEGPFIGGLDIPRPMYEQMSEARTVGLRTTRFRRVQHILRDYSDLSAAQVGAGLDKLAPSIGHAAHEECQRLLQQGRLAQLVDRLLDYYDRTVHYRPPEPPDIALLAERKMFDALADELIARIDHRL